MDPAWVFEHSVDCAASPGAAWAFWTDVRNWAIDADVDRIEIDGPFAAGTRGRTLSKSSGRIEWQLAEVAPGHAVIIMPVDGAAARCVWTFEEIETGVRMTQRMSLEGPKAAGYAATFGPMLEAGVPGGMKALSAAIEKANA